MEEIVKVVPEVVSLDIETTGLTPGKDRIIEVALIKLVDKIPQNKFTSLINPEINIPPSGFPVNKIKPYMFKNAPYFNEVAVDIFNFFKGETLLIQNADFDIPFLKEEFKKCNMSFPETYVYDTLLISKKLFSFERNSLSYLAQFYKLNVNGLHRAEKDALLAYEVFCQFFKEQPLEVLKLKRETSEINYVDTSLILKKIEDAINNGRDICIKYKNKNFDISTRHIEPLRVFEENGKRYLEGLCPLKSQRRKFRLDKIIEIIDNV